MSIGGLTFLQTESGLRIISNNREFWYWGVQLDPDLLVTISSLYPEWFRVSALKLLLVQGGFLPRARTQAAAQ
ncbi:hypothetical protein FJT64_013541 [Amphibalanus amphitrite]|uniref:Uncharacterized protein n=1 Tax=Amphibalanus amphitrite TaxID=1232801 RepID=A0A6A4V4G9_AMPAM|nr:hypothetical protein FJT64_013541 [Amphibalanus amphitrite]